MLTCRSQTGAAVYNHGITAAIRDTVIDEFAERSFAKLSIEAVIRGG